MTQEEIKKVLENHQHWLRRDVDGWENMRAVLTEADLTGADLSRADLSKADLTGADLTGADLSRADLRGAYLRGAYLRGAYLTGADLTGAYLTGADLTGADLSGAVLRGADLTGAYLRGADLSRADLRGAYLTGADLTGAYLTGAYLTGAYLTGADLTGAYLTGADLRGAYLTGADLTGVKNLNVTMACPTNGSFIGWKKAIHPEDKRKLLVKLLIPDDARRSSATTNKCRCDKAQVLEITDLKGNAFEVACSNHDNEFVYKVGETVKVDDFCADRFQECAAGIHFFVDREAAIRYEW